MTKPIRRFNLNFKNNLGVETKARRLILNVWAQLSGYFNVEVGSQNATGIVTYNYYPDEDGKSTGGNGGVQLRGSRSLVDEVIMHETLHALNFGKHSNLPSKFTVHTSSVSAGPFLRIQDFITLQRAFGTRDWDAERTEFSWGPGTQSGMQLAYRVTSNGINGPKETTERNLHEKFLYDFVWRSTGYNIFNFQNYSVRLLIDLRASEFNDKGMISGKRLFGSRIGNSPNWFGLNIINVPGVKLDEAWAGSGDDRVVGNERDNKLLGNAGRDTLCGLAGNDTLDGGDNANTADYSRDAGEGGAQGVIVNLSDREIVINSKTISAGTALDGFGSVDTLISIQNIVGTEFSDNVTGSSADNVFIGSAGDDTMNGGEGVDTVAYSADKDAGGGSGVIVDLQKCSATDGFGNRDILISIENVIGTSFSDILLGDEQANRLEGLDGSDQINGGAGVDTMIGGSGDDFYWVDNIGDQVIENRNSGRDRVIASVGYTLADNVEELFADESVKSGLSLTGNALSNLIVGSAFEDSLEGGLGRDTLNGGAGNDTLSGGRGSDTYVYGMNYGADVVRGFQTRGKEADYLLISSALANDFNLLLASASQIGSDLLFNFGQGNTLKLENVNLAQFSGRSNCVVFD